MMDEEEYGRVLAQYEASASTVRSQRARRNVPLTAVSTGDIYRQVQRLYLDIARGAGLNAPVLAAEHILKHRLAAFGPLCHGCKRPLRTPRAKRCAACGLSREA